MEPQAIVGSRDFENPAKAKEVVRKLLHSFPKGTTVVTGDAPRGVDVWVEELLKAERPDLVFRQKKANWDRFGISAGCRRNSQVIEEADRIHVIWTGKSSGSSDVVQKTRYMQNTHGTKVLVEYIVR